MRKIIQKCWKNSKNNNKNNNTYIEVILTKKLIYIEGYYAFSSDILKNIKKMFIYISIFI